MSGEYSHALLNSCLNVTTKSCIEPTHEPTCLTVFLLCRFVGLLLVTKLLPNGGQESVQSVHDALGMTFVARLLLPISRAAQVGWLQAMFIVTSPRKYVLLVGVTLRPVEQVDPN